VELGGGQYKNQMFGRFFEYFKQRVECGSGQHMYFVDDINAFFYVDRRKNGFLPQGPDVVDAVVGGRVQLQDVQDVAVIYPKTARAFVAGVAVLWLQAIDGFGQDFRARGLAGTARADEKVGVRQAARRHLRFERIGHMGLADDVVKCSGTPLSV
jgi:hypothetical protein